MNASQLPPLSATTGIPSAVLTDVLWTTFFFAVYRECSGKGSRLGSRRAAFLLALVLAVNEVVKRIVLNGGQDSLPSLVLVTLPLVAWFVYLSLYAFRGQDGLVRGLALFLFVALLAQGLLSNQGPVPIVLSFFNPNYSIPYAALVGSDSTAWGQHPLTAVGRLPLSPLWSILVWFLELCAAWLLFMAKPVPAAALNLPGSSRIPTAPA